MCLGEHIGHPSGADRLRPGITRRTSGMLPRCHWFALTVVQCARKDHAPDRRQGQDVPVFLQLPCRDSVAMRDRRRHLKPGTQRPAVTPKRKAWNEARSLDDSPLPRRQTWAMRARHELADTRRDRALFEVPHAGGKVFSVIALSACFVQQIGAKGCLLRDGSFRKTRDGSTAETLKGRVPRSGNHQRIYM